MMGEKKRREFDLSFSRYGLVKVRAISDGDYRNGSRIRGVILPRVIVSGELESTGQQKRLI